MKKGRVVLKGLAFYAYHGVYSSERLSGNKFEVDVSVDVLFKDSAFRDNLAGTIDYENLYAIVKTELAKPSKKLLESVAHTIAVRILKSFDMAIKTHVLVSKFNPPIGGACDKASVVVKLKKEEVI